MRESIDVQILFNLNLKFDQRLIDGPGGCLNKKMSSYQYSDPHVKDKTVVRPSYL